MMSGLLSLVECQRGIHGGIHSQVRFAALDQRTHVVETRPSRKDQSAEMPESFEALRFAVLEEGHHFGPARLVRPPHFAQMPGC